MKERSPFVVGTIIKDPSNFWGRKRERYDIIERLKNMGSLSIIGSRRIGKSSLAYYIFREGKKDLGQKYEFIWLDSQSNHSSSVNSFFNELSKNSTLSYVKGNDLTECLINFEDSVKAHSKKLIILDN